MLELQYIFFPVALAVLAALVTRRKGPKNLPPGPPGRDHTAFLEGTRWNTFKAWNEEYGLISLFCKLCGSWLTDAIWQAPS